MLIEGSSVGYGVIAQNTMLVKKKFNRLLAAAAANLASTATLYGTALSNLDESLVVNSVGASSAGGLLARWNATTNSGYMGVLTGTGASQQVEILAVQNLGTGSQSITVLGSAAAPGSGGMLEFKVSGTSLQLFYNSGAAIVSITNSLFTSSGGAGIGSTAGGSLFGTYALLSGS
jgi:hypothetical protein